MNRRDFLQSMIGLSILSQVADPLTGERIASTYADVSCMVPPADKLYDLGISRWRVIYVEELLAYNLVTDADFVDLDGDYMIGDV